MSPTLLAPRPLADSPTPAASRFSLTIQSDCTLLPEGYPSLGEQLGFAISLCPRMTAGLDDIKLKEMALGPPLDSWPRGLCLWRSGITAVDLCFYTRDPAKGPADPWTFHCICRATALQATGPYSPKPDRDLLENYCAGRDFGAAGEVIKRLETDLSMHFSALIETHQKKPNWAATIAGFFGSKDVDQETPGSATEARAWSFPGYCLELGRSYPVGAISHLGFVVRIDEVQPQGGAYFPQSSLFVSNSKTELLKGLGVVAFPVLDSKANAAKYPNTLRATPNLQPSPQAKDGLVSILYTPTEPPADDGLTTLGAEAQIVPMTRVADSAALLDMTSLFVRMNDNGLSRGRSVDAIETAVYRSFDLAGAVADNWSAFWANAPTWSEQKDFLLGFAGLASDMIGLASWRKDFDTYLQTIGLEKCPAGMSANDWERAKADAHSRYRALLPERVQQQVKHLLDPDPAKAAAQLADLCARLDRLYTETVPTPTDPRPLQHRFIGAICRGLDRAKRPNPITTACYELTEKGVSTQLQVEPILKRLPTGPALQEEAQRLLFALGDPETLCQIVIAAWMDDDPEASKPGGPPPIPDAATVKLRGLLTDAMKQATESHAEDWPAVVRRSLAAPFWSDTVNLIPDQTGTRPNSLEDSLFAHVAQALRARADAAVDPKGGAAEYRIMVPRLPDAFRALAGQVLTLDGPGPLRDRIDQLCSPARPRLNEQVLDPSALPRPLTVQVDRLSNSAGPDPDDPTADFATRISGFGVLASFDDSPWCCLNAAARGIDALRYATAVSGNPDTLRDALFMGPALFSDVIHPLRLGFVNGLRQTAITYTGDSLLGIGSSSEGSVTNRDVGAAAPGSASPLLWLSPGLPRIGAEPKRGAIPALKFRRAFKFRAFAVLNTGVLPPALASKAHPCAPRLTLDATPPTDDAQWTTKPTKYLRENRVAGPQLVPQTSSPADVRRFAAQAESLGPSLIDAVYLKQSDQLPVGQVRLESEQQITIRIDALDTQLEAMPADMIPGASALAAIRARAKLHLRLYDHADQTGPASQIVITRVPRQTDDRLDWSAQIGAGQPLILENVAPYATVFIALRSEPDNTVTLSLEARWDDYRLTPEPGSSRYTPVGLLTQREDAAQTQAISTLYSWPRVEHQTTHEEIYRKPTRLQLLLSNPDSPAVLIARPVIMVEGKAIDHRPEVPALRISSTDTKSLSYQILPPTTGPQLWQTWKTDADLDADAKLAHSDPDAALARAAVIVAEQKIRLAAHDARGAAEVSAPALAFMDPAVIGYIAELVPLFRPHGSTSIPQRSPVLNIKPQTLASHLKTMALSHQPREALYNELQKLPGAEKVLMQAEPVTLTVRRVEGAPSTLVINSSGSGLDITVAEGEALELRIYAILDPTTADRFAPPTLDAHDSLSVSPDPAWKIPPKVTSAAVLRVESVPGRQLAAHHLPDPSELLATLHPAFDPVGRVVSLECRIPAALQRRFAYVAELEGRTQQWAWRGECFRRDACAPTPIDEHPAEKPRPWDATYQRTSWGDQLFESTPRSQPLLAWESLASVRHREVSYAIARSLLPWRAAGLTLQSQKQDQRARFFRFALAARPRAGTAGDWIVARLPAEVSDPRGSDGLAQLRANAGLAALPSNQQLPMTWKRLWVPARLNERLPAPNVWMVLPLSRALPHTDSETLGITDALVLVHGAAFDHAGWGEDLDCEIIEITDPDVNGNPVTRLDVGSVPASTGSAVENRKGHKPPTAQVFAGPVGHSFDEPSFEEPLISATSYLVRLHACAWLKDGAGNRFDRALDARVRFRRVLRRAALGDDVQSVDEDCCSHFTPPMLLRCHVDSGALTSMLQLSDAQVRLGPTGTRLEWSSKDNSPPDPKVLPTLQQAANAKYELWVLFTLTADEDGFSSESFYGIAPLLEQPDPLSFRICTIDQSQVHPDSLRARVLLVQRTHDTTPNLKSQPQWPRIQDLMQELLPRTQSTASSDLWDRPESSKRIMSVSEPIMIPVHDDRQPPAGTP